MFRKKNGFTLVELLATIIILGMITAMAFPLLRRLKENNKNTRFELYRSSLNELAKTYVESYEEDLFPPGSSSNCAIISVEMLEQKKVFKDVNIESYSCNSPNTFIKVTYTEGDSSSTTFTPTDTGSATVVKNRKYEYTAYLGCGVQNDEGKVNPGDIDTIYPEKDDGPYDYTTICS